jgi:predicted nucleic acid-binding protein
MIVVDSSVLIGYFRKAATPAVIMFRTLLDAGELIVGDIMLLELLQGASDDQNARLIELQLREFSIVNMFDDNIAIEAARNYRTLRSNGITNRKTNDLIIGTYCILHGHQLLHMDRDFDPMEQYLGLRVAKSAHFN